MLIRFLILALLFCATSARSQTVLTLQVHWADGLKASGKVTLTGNGLLCNGATCSATDANDGIYHLTVPLAANGAYLVTWTSSYYGAAKATYSFPFFIGCIPFTTVCLDPKTMPSAEADLIFARPTDAGGFRLRDARALAHFEFP